MAGLCREFGISRKTGYTIYDRDTDCGLDGLSDRSRRPSQQANRLPMRSATEPAQLCAAAAAAARSSRRLGLRGDSASVQIETRRDDVQIGESS